MDDLTPVTRTERLLDGEDLTPTNREEMFIKRIYDKTQEIPEPVNRKEYFLKKAGEAGGDVTVVPLSVTENGTYSEAGKAYSPVTVEVEPPENSYQLKSITTPTSLATFEASEMPMPKLKVSVEAKQDLHGYDHPWPAGAGKNKLPMTVDTIKSFNTGGTWNNNTYSINGVTFTILTDNSGNILGIATSGTSSNYIYFTLAYVDAEIGMIINGAPTGGDRYKWFQAIDTTSDFDYGNGATISISVTNKKFMIVVANGVDMSNKTFHPMLRLSTETDATFAPYSNICPISGWDEAKVSDASENIYDSTDTTAQNPTASNVTIINTKSINVKGVGTGTYPASKQLLSEYSLTNGKTYKIRANAIVSSGKPIIAIRASNNSIVISTDTSASGSGILELKFTYDSETMNYISFFSNYGKAYGDVTYSDIMFAEVVSTTISLGQTVYGAEVDVVNGILKITDDYIASYNGETLPSTWISSMDEYAEGTSPTTGAEVCYELAEPIIINLTPTLIKSLDGLNNLSVDCGEVIEGEYFIELGGE